MRNILRASLFSIVVALTPGAIFAQSQNASPCADYLASCESMPCCSRIYYCGESHRGRICRVPPAISRSSKPGCADWRQPCRESDASTCCSGLACESGICRVPPVESYPQKTSNSQDNHEAVAVPAR